MRVSVAMCTYRGAQYLEEQLASILEQVRLPDEVLICDDGSHDNTLEIVKSFAARAPFETYIHCNKTTLGSTKNFEKAIQLCSGDIIALSDQDDVWHQQKLARIEQVFLRNPQIGGVFTNADIVDQNLRPFGFSLWDVVHFSIKEQMLMQKGKALDIVLKHLVVTGATLAFRSSWKDALTPIPSCWMHDAWIALNLAVFSKLSIIQEKLISYRQHGNNQIGGMRKGIKFRISETLSMDREVYYASELERYQVAYDHFCKWFSAEHETMKKLSSKIHHLQTRSRLPARRGLRIPVILKELFTGKYGKYSTSWQVAVRDLLIP
jgi:glycosyltransferase involved in cell wall biosynthesis